MAFRATLCLLLAASVQSFVPHVPRALRRVAMRAIDYKDPVVAAEFAQIQTLDPDEVEEELNGYGIPMPETMNDFDVRLMLTEMRLRMTGRLPGNSKKEEKKTKFSSDFERYLYEKPAFKKLYSEKSNAMDVNAVNVIIEYVTDKKKAIGFYAKTYGPLIAEIEAALNSKIVVEVTSPKLQFSGFPINVGEAGLKMTLESVGPIVSFAAEESDDYMTLAGTVEFEDVATAKAVVEKYNGMDMGMGSALEILPA